MYVLRIILWTAALFEGLHGWLHIALVRQTDGDHVSAGEIMASSGPGGYCGGYEPVECETRGYSLSIQGNMTLHTRPSIPSLLQQGNTGNTQGIQTAVTQWPLIWRHPHFLVVCCLPKSVNIFFLALNIFCRRRETNISGARVRVTERGVELPSPPPTPGLMLSDVTRHGGCFLRNMSLRKQWINPSTQPSIQWKYLRLHWNLM